MKLRIFPWITLIVVLMYSAAFAGECGNFPDRDFESKENMAFKGLYENGNYMYAVTIPNGLTGYSSPPDSPQHGFGIVLDWNTHAYIMIDSSANSFEYKSLIEALEKHISYLREDGTAIKSIKTKKIQLGKVPATRAEIHYSCSKTKEERVQVVVISLRAKRALIDIASLDTTVNRIKSDLPTLEKIVSSWRVTGKY